ncbi:DUF3997 domain-containing protein [Peribacillus sp. B-H-3]|uniref:DUF3997 domain-containing protein n=1 Tax=Peribacillus sp. B-H-3 TaxID=3400420 RepID=UPI003B02732E
MKKVISILFLLILLTGCIGPGLSDSEHKITEKYWLIKNGRNKSILVKKVNSSEFKEFEILVPDTVISTAVHNDCIFAKQQNYSLEEHKLDKFRNYYWIISISSEHVVGPLSLKKFTYILNDLEIGSEVKWVNNNML